MGADGFSREVVASWPRPAWATDVEVDEGAVALNYSRPASATDYSGRGVEVTAEAMVALSAGEDGAAVVEREPATICVCGVHFTVAGARQLAAVLVELADAVEGIEGPGTAP